MGKKRTRTKYTSKGERPIVSKSTLKAASRDVPAVDRALHKIDAWKKGKNPWITIPNPSGSKKEAFIRVKANSLYGDPRFVSVNIYKGSVAE
jgi:hypothetical protein